MIFYGVKYKINKKNNVRGEVFMPKITVSDLTAIYSDKKAGDVIALDGLNAEFLSDAFNVIVGYSGVRKNHFIEMHRRSDRL